MCYDYEFSQVCVYICIGFEVNPRGTVQHIFFYLCGSYGQTPLQKYNMQLLCSWCSYMILRDIFCLLVDRSLLETARDKRQTIQVGMANCRCGARWHGAGYRHVTVALVCTPRYPKISWGVWQCSVAGDRVSHQTGLPHFCKQGYP